VIRGDLSQILAVRFSRLTAAPFFHFQRFRTGRAGRGTDTADGAPGFGHWRWLRRRRQRVWARHVTFNVGWHGSANSGWHPESPRGAGVSEWRAIQERAGTTGSSPPSACAFARSSAS